MDSVVSPDVTTKVIFGVTRHFHHQAENGAKLCGRKNNGRQAARPNYVRCRVPMLCQGLLSDGYLELADVLNQSSPQCQPAAQVSDRSTDGRVHGN